jgi:drug/metabolite transporter (DMT)-like permease
MNNLENKNSIRNSLLTFTGALLCCFLWGSAFPCIKIGYRLWGIDSSDTWSIIRFAGIRFALAGLLVIILGSIIKKKPLLPMKNEIPKIMFLSLFQTIGQYLFFYLGLAHTTGINSAVVDSLTSFFAIIIASLIFRMENLTWRKILGCVLGFIGVLLINITGAGLSINPLGDGLVALSALCYGISSVMIKRYSEDHDTVLFSGYQFVFGGLVMTLAGQIGKRMVSSENGSIETVGGVADSGLNGAGGNLTNMVLILLYLALISSVAYTLWGILLKYNDVSKISIFGFMNPVFGVVLSAILLGEYSQLGLKYVLALLLVSAGIVIVNVKVKSKIQEK